MDCQNFTVFVSGFEGIPERLPFVTPPLNSGRDNFGHHGFTELLVVVLCWSSWMWTVDGGKNTSGTLVSMPFLNSLICLWQSISVLLSLPILRSLEWCSPEDIINLFRHLVHSAFSTCFPASYWPHQDNFTLRCCPLVAIIDELPFRVCGGAVDSWLVCSTPDRVVRVQALAEVIVLCS